MLYKLCINYRRSCKEPLPIGQVIFGDIDMAINPNDQIKELEERFQHYDIDNHEKDRLIWQYLVNRKNRRDNDPKQNEIDTDWGN
ncbi:hypothetical protein [Polynucleobacter sp. UK-FUSCHL-C3]|jgi:hypothetical protein|uniref:Uncharacterized protein n=1 Tax=Polynucleobacter sp. UK-FUSCHL-C3 TaxID=2955208 RepID=A0AAU8A0A6_9BURK